MSYPLSSKSKLSNLFRNQITHFTGSHLGASLRHDVAADYDIYSAQNLAENISRQIQNMNLDCTDTYLKPLTVSCGICAAPYAAASMNELISNADCAVYHVKRSGKNGIRGIGKEHHIVMVGGHEQVLDIILLNGLHPLDALASAVLASEIIHIHTLDVPQMGHGNDGVLVPVDQSYLEFTTPHSSAAIAQNIRVFLGL